MIEVSVTYPLNDGFKDDVLDEVAGKESCSSGCWMMSDPPERDRQYQFDTKAEADAFVEKVKELDFVKGYSVE